jgi:hypothetical protein
MKFISGSKFCLQSNSIHAIFMYAIYNNNYLN